MKKINRKLISGVFAAIVVLFSLVFFTGKSRTIHGAGGFLEQVAYYHTVSFALFDRELKENRTGMEDRTWGRMNVGGLDIITGLFARKLGFPDYGKDMEKTGRLLQDQLEVGPGKYANAFYGIMYAFYRDGGWTGFVIFPLIWGFLLSRAFHLLRKTGKEYFFSIVLLGMHIAIFSLFQNQLDSFSVWICLLALAVRHNFIEEVE